MLGRRIGAISLMVSLGVGPRGMLRAADPTVDLSGYRADCGIAVQQVGSELKLSWRSPSFGERPGQLVLDLRSGRPLIRSMGVSPTAGLPNADPVTFLLVGTREAPKGRPPDMSAFNVFFDSPAKRPYQTYRSKLDLKRVRVTSQGRRTTIALGDLSIGPFNGELRLTVYSGAALVHVEAVVRTQEERRAILYDTGLAVSTPGLSRFSWLDTEGRSHHDLVDPNAPDRPLTVRNRVLVAGTDDLSIACFPPPHQFFSPRDLTDNLSTVWYGRHHRGLDNRFGFGIRQS